MNGSDQENQLPAGALWMSSSATSCGPGHEINEDAHIERPDAGLFAVADGVGGHEDGGVASRAIIEILNRVISEGADLDERVQIVEDALHAVNAALWRAAQSAEPPHTVGSTVVALLISNGYAVCFWAGDSRAYLHRGSHFYQLTRDHNLATDFGIDTLNGAALTRAVGSSAELKLDRIVTALKPDDTLLICSDGITKVMDDQTIAMRMQEPIRGLAARLVATAIDQGGRDDITAIAVRYHGT